MKRYNLVFIPVVDILILRDESNEQHFGIIIDYLNKVKAQTRNKYNSKQNHQSTNKIDRHINKKTSKLKTITFAKVIKSET